MERSRKYYALLVISATLLLGTLVNSPDAYAAKPTSIVVQYNGPGATVNVQKSDTNPAATTDQNNLNPCDGPASAPCDTTVTVANGETFQVLPITGKSTLESDSCFFVGGSKILFNNKPSSSKNCLHTSCSAPLIAGVTTDSDPGLHMFLVVDIFGTGLGDDCMPAVVGGSGFVIDKTALLLATAQTNALWLIPVIVSAIGIGIVIARKF